MADFEVDCAAKGIALAVPPATSPKQNGCAERMQATWGNTCCSVQDTELSVAGLNPLIDEYLALNNGERPHDSCDGMTPNEYLESRRICEAPPFHMS